MGRSLRCWAGVRLTEVRTALTDCQKRLEMFWELVFC